MIRRVFQIIGFVILCFSAWKIYQNHCACTQDIGLLPGIVLGASLLAIPEGYSLDLIRIVFWGFFLASLFAITEVNSEWNQMAAFIIALFILSRLGLPYPIAIPILSRAMMVLVAAHPIASRLVKPMIYE